MSGSFLAAECVETLGQNRCACTGVVHLNMSFNMPAVKVLCKCLMQVMINVFDACDCFDFVCVYMYCKFICILGSYGIFLALISPPCVHNNRSV